MRNVSTLSLHPARIVQLKQIGAALGGLGMAETVERLINGQIKLGTIPDTPPGVRIEVRDAHVTVTLDNVTVTLTGPEAYALTESFTDFLTSMNRSPAMKFDFASGDHWIIGRVGRGFVSILGDKDDQKAKLTATGTMLNDIRRHIFDAALKAGTVPVEDIGTAA